MHIVSMRNSSPPKSQMCNSYCYEDLHEPHYLDSCSLCSKPLGFNSDIFMYRGDTPFCSKECRREQMEMDEAKEKKNWKVSSSSSRSHMKSDIKNSSSTSTHKSVSVA